MSQRQTPLRCTGFCFGWLRAMSAVRPPPPLPSGASRHLRVDDVIDPCPAMRPHVLRVAFQVERLSLNPSTRVRRPRPCSHTQFRSILPKPARPRLRVCLQSIAQACLLAISPRKAFRVAQEAHCSAFPCRADRGASELEVKRQCGGIGSSQPSAPQGECGRYAPYGRCSGAGRRPAPSPGASLQASACTRRQAGHRRR